MKAGKESNDDGARWARALIYLAGGVLRLIVVIFHWR
jgi:hypothetical protein